MWWLTHGSALYGAVLVGFFLLIAIWETRRPRRAHALPTGKRWLLHGFLLLVGAETTALVFRGSAIAMAFAVSDSPYGLLNRPWIPYGVRFLLAFLLLDFSQYVAHYLRHSIPLLWRFHQVHHADHDVDLSTGVRFHPGDILITQGIYFLTIAALAPPVLAVLCFELCSVAQALFSHANVALPPRIENAVRLLLVTPEFHQTHHSADAADQRANLAVLFSCWDRFFGTCRGRARTGASELFYGVEEVSAAQSIRPLTMLALPFVKKGQASFLTDKPAAPLSTIL